MCGVDTVLRDVTSDELVCVCGWCGCEEEEEEADAEEENVCVFEFTCCARRSNSVNASFCITLSATSTRTPDWWGVRWRVSDQRATVRFQI